MSRRIHLFGKKRGDRRSVPHWMGPIGEIAFFAGLVVCGLAACGYLLWGYLLPEWWANRHFVESTCQVVAVRIGEREIDGARRYRPEIQIRYQADGQTRGPTWTYDARFAYEFDREGAEQIASQFKPLARYICWYDPINPANVVVVRDLSVWSWLLLCVPAAVAAFGGYKLVRTALAARQSVERRAQSGTVTTVQDKSRFAGRQSGGGGFPAVPAIDDIMNSPGTHLAYRLPSDGTSTWRTSGLAAMAIFFGIVLIVLLSSALASADRASRRIAEIGFVIPLIAVQIVLSRHAFRQWLRSTSSGSSRVEVSEHPFFPGEQYQIMLVQTGKMKVRRLEVQLLCQEEATYSPGTDTRIARETVHRDVLWRRDFLEIRLGAALEIPFDLRIPEGAMHSMVAEHNRVDWFILVRIRTAAGGFDRRFPVCVYPPVPAASAGSYRIPGFANP